MHQQQKEKNNFKKQFLLTVWLQMIFLFNMQITDLIYTEHWQAKHLAPDSNLNVQEERSYR